MTIDKNQRALAQLSAIYQPGTLNLIGGRPGMGKTTLTFYLATEAQLPTVYFSLEMSSDQLLLHLVTGKCPEWIHLDDTVPMTVELIRTKVHQLQKTQKIRWVVVDYLQLMSSSQPYSNRTDEIVLIIKELKEMAEELQVAVIVLTQLMRTVMMHDDYRPTLQDVHDWERIGKWADDVRLLHRDEYYHIVGGKRDMMEVLATECGRSSLPDMQLTTYICERSMWEMSEGTVN